MSLPRLLICLALAAAGARAPAQEPLRTLMDQAREAQLAGQWARSIELLNQVLAQEPNLPQAYFLRGVAHDSLRRYEAAIADFDRVFELDQGVPQVYNHRGATQFKLGRIEAAIADFDRALEMAPEQRPYHWQRGIALYLADRFEEARRQFELHRTVNPDDVENAAWHFACAARLEGPEAARRALLPEGRDDRVAMKEIYALYAGTGSEAAIFAAARAGDPPPLRLHPQLFYSHYYVALYHEANGRSEPALEHLTRAAEDHPVNQYMGDVARVHLELRRRAAAAPKP